MGMAGTDVPPISNNGVSSLSIGWRGSDEVGVVNESSNEVSPPSMSCDLSDGTGPANGSNPSPPISSPKSNRFSKPVDGCEVGGALVGVSLVRVSPLRRPVELVLATGLTGFLTREAGPEAEEEERVNPANIEENSEV